MRKTIKKLKAFDPFDTDNGQLYPVYIEFEDGSDGLAYSKNDKPPYTNGDEVEVELKGTQTKKGVEKVRVKIPKDNDFGGSKGSGPASFSRNDKAIVTQVVYKGVIELVCANKLDLDDIEKTVRDHYDWLAFLCGLESEPVKGLSDEPLPLDSKKDEEDDLPF